MFNLDQHVACTVSKWVVWYLTSCYLILVFCIRTILGERRALPSSQMMTVTLALASPNVVFVHQQGGAAWLTAEEESDRISMKKKTNYIKSTLLSFLKVCLYGWYTNCQFYRISLFHQLNIVFCKISENHFSKDCILNFTSSSLKLTWTLEIALNYFFLKKYFLKYII